MLDINLFYNRAENKIANLTEKLLKKYDRQGLEGIMDECEVEQINVLSEIIDAVSYDEANAQELIGLAYSKFELAEVPTSPFLHIVNNINQQGGGGVTSWNDLTGKPSTFPPSVHTHPQSQITGLVDKLAELETMIETGGAPVAPSGVSWITQPAFSLDGTALTVGASSINNNGVTVNIAASVPPLTVSLAAAGKKRLDAIVANYTAETPVYEQVAGTEVFDYLTAARVAIPANRLLVRYLDVTDTLIEPVSPNFVKTIGINGETETPDEDGNVDLFVAAETLYYTPEDSNNSTGFFAGLLTAGKLFISAALNRIVTKIGNLTSLTTTNKTNLVAAINEVNAKPTGSAYTDADAIKAPLPVVTYTGSATLALTDMGKLVNIESASACAITIPPDIFPVYAQIPLDWGDAAGQPTMTPGSGVTLQSAGNKYKIAERKGGIIIHQIAANTWRMKGATA